MKKILTILLIGVFVLTVFCNDVYAKGSIKPSKTSMSITEGGSGSFSISASNAAGRVDISTSDSSVATVSVKSKWLDNNSVTVKVTGKKVGTATITVRLSDAATFDEEVLNKTYKITVKVTEPKSGNNSLTSISVDGYKLVKKSETSYTLDVGNSVSKITIKASAADEKATVSGTGTKTLKEGKNTFNVVVTAESGAKKTYTITVTRKDGYYLEDLNDALKTSSPSIKLREGDKLTKEHLDKIKSTGKRVLLNAMDKEGDFVYGWNIDGSKLSTYEATETGIKFDSEYKEEIGALSNYADGKYVHFEQTGAGLNGTTIKINVEDKYDDKHVLNIYIYNKETNTLSLAIGGVSVLNGNVELNLKEYGDYLITRASLNKQLSDNSNNINENISSNSVDYKMFAIIEACAIVLLIIVIIAKGKKK